MRGINVKDFKVVVTFNFLNAMRKKSFLYFFCISVLCHAPHSSSILVDNSKIATKQVCTVTESQSRVCNAIHLWGSLLNWLHSYQSCHWHGCDSNHTAFGSTWPDATPSLERAQISLHPSCLKFSPHPIRSQTFLQHSLLPNKGPVLGPGSQTIYTVCMSGWRGICCGLKVQACIPIPRWQYRDVGQMGHTHYQV